MQYISGEDRNQISMLPPSIDEYVTEDNPVRVIDAFVDSLDVAAMGFKHSELNSTGRPPYASQDMLKLYIYGYFNRIRSSRCLERETHRNLEVIWLMKNLRPDHKTIARFRHDNTKALKNTFKAFVTLCAKCGLYGKTLFSIDGSKFAGCNSKDRNFNSEKLKDRIARIDQNLEKYLSELESNDNGEAESETGTNCSIQQIISELTERRDKYQGMLEDLKESGETQISLTDPDCRRMTNSMKKTVVGYNVQTAVDSKNGLIASYKVTNQVTDMGQLHDVGAEAKDNLKIKSKIDLLADKGYNSATDIAECYADNMNANVCMDIEEFDICVETDEDTPKPETHQNGRCVYLKERNVCICPMGEILYPAAYRTAKHSAKFNNFRKCRLCKHRCTTATAKQFEVWMLPSEFSKEYNIENLHVKQVRIKPNKELLKQRKCLSEHPFGTVKRAFHADYLLTKGLTLTDGEFALAFLIFNMKRALSVLGIKKLTKAIRAV